MSCVKKIPLLIYIINIVSKFIQPGLSKSPRVLSSDNYQVCNIFIHVQTVLKNASYNCHSNNNNYPCYPNIYPVGWILEKRKKNGKAE